MLKWMSSSGWWFFCAKNVARHVQHRVESSTFSKTFCEMSCQNSTLQKIKGNVPYFPVKRNMLQEKKSTMLTSSFMARYNQKKCYLLDTWCQNLRRICPPEQWTKPTSSDKFHSIYWLVNSNPFYWRDIIPKKNMGRLRLVFSPDH